MYTVYICLGGTGTQLGNIIGNLYPLLGLSGLEKTPFTMFIMDKDTTGGIYKSCTDTHNRYAQCREFFPYHNDALEPYILIPDVYQEMQDACGFKNRDKYSVLDLIGDDKEIMELAAMCWTSVKRDEDLKPGNNRDPSRGSLDARVCMEHIGESSLFQGKAGLKTLLSSKALGDTRVVLLGGVTGGMGSSLIVPLVKKLREHYDKLRIDMVLLGPYFKIPARIDDHSEVNNIGDSNDSFYRAADQINELKNLLKNGVNDGNDWRVYYAAMPKFDDTAGEFRKNGPTARQSHLAELTAALAAIAFGQDRFKEAPGFYETAFGINPDRVKDETIGWADIPLGEELRKPATDFIKLLSVLACKVYPAIRIREKEGGKYANADRDRIKKDPYLRPYFKKNPSEDMELIDLMQSRLRAWLQNARPYFMLWKEVQESTHLGVDDKSCCPVKLFPQKKDMDALAAAFDFDNSKVHPNEMPFCATTWSNFINEVKVDKKRQVDAVNADSILKWMMEDIWNFYHKEKEKEN